MTAPIGLPGRGNGRGNTTCGTCWFCCSCACFPLRLAARPRGVTTVRSAADSPVRVTRFAMPPR
ncbi:Uncharacterized protein LI90_1351 [Carbonactinospora thermoautotrophica]|uniref:Uncharacterized protein n=1 Tax=Carbonactinospora thermoautotrophica TaxID=1469144 RepID=A0A132MPD8_9ACTN|nr:Uncharacterized protein LI90_1351 [Carbonactinospora thermoautotrophica]